MRNTKFFLLLLAVSLFACALLAGLYAPGWIKAREDRAFVPATIEKDIESAFAAQFETLDRATAPKFLPDMDFHDIDGGKAKITDFSGRPTLVNFWATWCLPCVVELPSLSAFARLYEEKVNVVAIALEEGRKPEDIARFLKGREVGDFAGYVDSDGGLTRALALRGLPTSFLIGEDGHILYRFEGDAEWTSPDARAFFDAVLAQKR